jgi:cupin domain
MRKRITVAFAISVLAAVAVVGSALATTAIGLTSTTLATGTLDPVNVLVNNGDWKVKLQTKGETSVQVVQNVVAPGGTFGWHSHPGPSLIVVKSGTMTFYHADDPTCSPDVRHAGDALLDSGTDVHTGRNEGTVDAVVIVTRLIPVGAAPRIDEPKPSNCGF